MTEGSRFPDGRRDGTDLWCTGSLLEHVQRLGIYDDSKTFVDMPVRNNPSDVNKSFAALLNRSGGKPARDAVRQFLEANFLPAGGELETYTPQDHVPRPPSSRFLPTVKDEGVREWAHGLHNLWKDLCRKVKDADGPGSSRASSLLPMHGWAIIPGARFREVYYWDSYWVVRGLLVSNMGATAKAEVGNLLALLRDHLHVPNGGRTYYLNRSQPPLLSAMVSTLLDAAPDPAFLANAYAALLLEHKYWTAPPKAVEVADGAGNVWGLARYYAAWDQPRPESYREDVATAAGLPRAAAAALWRELASGAESGWDFSSRWMAVGERPGAEGSGGLTALRTTRVLPADLNAFLVGLERDLARFAAALGHVEDAARFAGLATARAAAVQALMWDAAAGCWSDLVIDNAAAEGPSTATRRPGGRYASDYVPLWLGLATGPQAEQVVASLQCSGLVRTGGVATSLVDSGQQWDGSNAWPPLQAMVVEGLMSAGPKGVRLAHRIVQAWLASNYRGWQECGAMAEKYSADVPGMMGGGGEYNVQLGFGWTNGVALMFLDKFGWHPELL